MKGILKLVKSKNAPVFKEPDAPLDIQFTVLPRIDEPFLFTSDLGFCNTSTVKAIDSETGEYLLKTLNSTYLLQVIK